MDLTGKVIVAPVVAGEVLVKEFIQGHTYFHSQVVI